MRLDSEAIRALVHRDRVHRSLYLDSEVFDLEMHKIFGSTWVYVGHESLVPKPGDFITTRIGKHPVVVSRHADGKIYVIHNSCGHRGAIVCNEAKGNAQIFRCCYHGWTFKTNGDLDAVAMPRGYGKDFDFTNPALGMGRLPRVGIYRGFVFASLAKKGPSLDEHLGHAKDLIDELCDRAPQGEIDLGGGVHKYLFRGNWKLQLENAVDMYHVPFSHEFDGTPQRQAVRPPRRRGFLLRDQRPRLSRAALGTTFGLGRQVERSQLQRPSADRGAAPRRSGVQHLPCDA